NHLRNGAPADGAEGDIVAREHHAVLLWTIVALSLVQGALESSDLSGEGVCREELAVDLPLLEKERVHLFLRAFLRTDLPALLQEFASLRLEGLLGPRSGNGRARRHELLPLQGLRIEKGGGVGLPR